MGVTQNLSNTVFIDCALIVIPCLEDEYQSGHLSFIDHYLEHESVKFPTYIYVRVFFTRKSARFYAFRNKSTPSTPLPSMLARTNICKCTRSDYRLFLL